jgi:hypothetical protein
MNNRARAPKKSEIVRDKTICNEVVLYTCCNVVHIAVVIRFDNRCNPV